MSTQDLGTSIQVMTVTSVANVKAPLSAFVESVSTTHERVVITRHGEPAAVLISPEDMEALEETIAIVADPQVMADIGEAQRAMAEGEVADMADISRREVSWPTGSRSCRPHVAHARTTCLKTRQRQHGSS